MILRNIKRFSPYMFCGLSPFENYDKASDNKTIKLMHRTKMENETPMDRLYLMFSVDEFGVVSPEMNAVSQATFLGLFAGAVYGGFIRSKIAYEDFLSNNQASSFSNHLDAKKQLQTKVTMGFAKGAFMWGWRLALFCGGYVLLTTTISVYQGKSSILEYLVAGGVMGGLYKFKTGPRAMLVGSGLGMALGGIAGTASLAILWLTGTTMEEVRYWQYQLRESRNQTKRDIMAGHVAEDELMKEHKQLLKQKGLD